LGDEIEKTKKQINIPWHPAFFQAINLELIDYKELLTFEAEHHLTAEPLRIDVVIIKNPAKAKIQKNIGKIFLGNNICEYKSPSDSLSVSDYYKSLSYTYLYISQNGVDIRDVTLSFVITVKPRDLIKLLRSRNGITVTEEPSGIHVITGETFPIQIIESKKLNENENLWLKALSNKASDDLIQSVIKESKKFPSEKVLAYIHALITAKSTRKGTNKVSDQEFAEIMSSVGYVTIERLEAAEELLEEERKAAEVLIEEERKAAEVRHEEERKAAEVQLEEERKAAEIRLEEERKISKEQREAAKRLGEELHRAAVDRLRDERRKAAEQRKAAERHDKAVVLMLNNGLAPDSISECLDIPIEEVLKIQSKLSK
jgi:hypothetical protein